jgi:Zn-dependent M28 family amino/carboxypeptidase
LRGRLERHVQALAGEIGERHLWRPEALAAAAAYIERTLADMGYAVVSQTYETHGRSVRNLEAELEGTLPEGGIVVIGAHYDTVRGTPGANDNASGVAALLELAHQARERRPARTLRFVAFVNEEPPWFYTQAMGSRVYARRARERGENIVAMISLETIGYYTEAPNSQRYPIPFFHLFYPSRGDFIAFVGNLASRDLVRRSIAAFRRHAAFPSEGVAAPGWVGGVHWSDHWSFWQEGYPAIMVTDTALFRYPYYHAAGDVPDRLNFDGLARVVAGLGAVVAELAEMDPADRGQTRQPRG